MKTLTVSAVRKRLGALLDAVQHEPVPILRKNRDACLVISAEEYRRIQGSKGAIPGRPTIDPKTEVRRSPLNGSADVIVTGDADLLGDASVERNCNCDTRKLSKALA
jgi:prevent-host-death family protein